MKITDVKVILCNSPPLVAIASITIDKAIAINDIKVIYTGNKYHIQFPNHPTTKAHGKNNIVPITNEARLQIENSIIQEVKKKRSE